jgi:hypothetical protein
MGNWFAVLKSLSTNAVTEQHSLRNFGNPPPFDFPHPTLLHTEARPRTGLLNKVKQMDGGLIRLNVYQCFENPCIHRLVSPWGPFSQPIKSTLQMPATMQDNMSERKANGNDLHREDTHESVLDRVRSAGLLTISPEMFEKLYLNPKTDVKGDLRGTFANPTPL